jgi:NDP-sugar pyrophosphorylase family protein
MNPTLLILAAGMGSRYGGLKQIDPMGPSGETVLDYSVFDALRSGFGKVVFVIRRDFEHQFRSQVGAKFESRIPVEYAFQALEDLPPGFSVPEGRSKPWGTTHAMLAAESLIHEPCVMINADDFYGRDAFESIARFLKQPAPASDRSQYCMVGFKLKNTLSAHGSVARGVCTADADGNLTSVTEMTKIFQTTSGAENREEGSPVIPLTGEEPVSMNFWGFTPEIFGQLREAFVGFLRREGSELKSECYVPKVVDVLIRSAKARVRVLPTTSRWFGVTYPEDKKSVQENIRALAESGEYPHRLWE